MAEGIGGWLKSTAASLEGHVKEIRENSKLIAADVASNVKDLEKAGRKLQKSLNLGVLAPGTEEVRIDVTFVEGSLGLNLDLAQGGQVLKLTSGGQAEALGLRLEDRVVAIGGEALPSISDRGFQEALKQKLSKLPRPVDMTFVRVVPKELKDQSKDSKEKEKDILSEKEEEMESLQSKLEMAVKDTQAAREETDSLAAELKLRKSWAAQDAEELEMLRSETGQLRERLEASTQEAEERAAQSGIELEKERARTAEATEQLVLVRSKETELQRQLQVAQQTLSNQEAAASAEGDAKVQQLQRSLSELRSAYEDVNLEKSSLEKELQQLGGRIKDLETERAEAAERAVQSGRELEQERAKTAEATEHLVLARSKETELQRQLQVAQQAISNQEAAVSAEGDAKVQHLQRSLSELQRAYEDVNLQKGSLEEELQHLAGKINDLETHRAEAAERAAQSGRELEQERTKTAEATEQLVLARSKETELQRQLQGTQQALSNQEAAASAEGGAKVQQLQMSLSELQRAYADLNLEKSSLEEELEQLGGKFKALETERAEAEERAAQSRRELEHERAKTAEATDQLVLARSKETRATDREEDQAPMVYGKEFEEVPETARLLEDTMRRDLQSKVGELEAQNAALKRSLNQRPIVYQFAPPDDGMDEEEEEPALETSTCGLLHGGCSMAIRRCRRLWSLCRKHRCMSSLEHQLRWFTRRLLEKPCLLWVFYFHVIVLWCIEIWRQALTKPLAMDPALSLESAVHSDRGS